MFQRGKEEKNLAVPGSHSETICDLFIQRRNSLMNFILYLFAVQEMWCFDIENVLNPETGTTRMCKNSDY
jgi:hypothetical protein